MKRTWLIEARESKKLTHDEIAALVGIDRSTYTRYESGTRTPKPSTAAKIAFLLGFDAGYFFWHTCTETEQKGDPNSAA